MARDQAWMYLKRSRLGYFLEIHHDGGPWGADKEVRIPLTKEQAKEVKVAFKS